MQVECGLLEVDEADRGWSSFADAVPDPQPGRLLRANFVAGNAYVLHDVHPNVVLVWVWQRRARVSPECVFVRSWVAQRAGS